MSATHDGGITRYPIRVDPAFRGLFALLGAGARLDVVEVDADAVRVRLGWLFRSTIPRTAIAGVLHHADMFGGWGAHGWRGRWLVNGSSKGIVEIDLAARQRAWLLGVWPISLRVLYVSLTDPDAFLTELGA
jgi:hypothetical protein